MTMNPWLAELLGDTEKTAQQAQAPAPTPEVEKNAEAEKVAMFLAAAEANNISKDQMLKLAQEKPELVNQLWEATFSNEEQKTASAAEVELGQTIGKIAAQTFVAELQKTASDSDRYPGHPSGEYSAKSILDQVRRGPEKPSAAEMGKRHAENVAEKAKEVGSKALKAITDHPKASAGAGLAGLAAGGALAAKRHYDKKKSEGSDDKTAQDAAAAVADLNEIAGGVAVKMAADAGFNVDEAILRISGVLALGGAAVDSYAKTASATDGDSAVYIRSLELLESAGYPVKWNGLVS